MVQLKKFRKLDFEIVVGSKVPPSGPIIRSGLEAETIRGARGGHAHFPTKSGPKNQK